MAGGTFEAVGLTRRYGRHVVFHDLDVLCPPGRVLVVRGRNGCGKSTLLRCLQGTEPLDAGTVHLDGEAVDTGDPAYWGRVHGVLDDHTWLPGLSVADHLRLLDPRCDLRAALGAFGVHHLADRHATSLSAGQRQRAALATALVRPWRVLLLDEPERRLDDEGVARTARMLAGFAERRRTVVVATHSHALLRALPAHVLQLGRAR